jgi:carboxypeptidase Taq
MSTEYDELARLLREAQTLISAAELLGWDQETMMPRKAAPFRAEEKALLSTLAHERATHPRLGELIATCESDTDLCADPEIAANLREIRRAYDRAVKLPLDLVTEMSETSSLAMEAWKGARESSNFSVFQPWLEKQIRLNRRKAECWGAPAGGELYDALLDDFEPDTSCTEMEAIFRPLRAELTPLIQELTASARQPTDAPFRAAIPPERQHAFNCALLERIGFDLGAGRLDTSAHPFSAGLGPGDTRITTRYREDGFLDALGSSLHEAGHGLYEQGLPKERLFGQPLAEPLGLAIHESQSRLWENHVGRSRAFCEWALPEMRRFLGPPLESITVDALYEAVNTVRAGLIRVESDEATYHLHIMLRFDLERALFRDELRPADLPAAWNERIKQDLGLEVPDDRRGCLQDIHWSMGAIGYFPTYTLGSLYAAQWWEAILRDVPDLPEQISRGDFEALLSWLRSNIHVHGRRFPAAELCRRVSGKPLDHGPLMHHLKRKLRPIYGIGGSASAVARK